MYKKLLIIAATLGCAVFSPLTAEADLASCNALKSLKQNRFESVRCVLEPQSGEYQLVGYRYTKRGNLVRYLWNAQGVLLSRTAGKNNNGGGGGGSGGEGGGESPGAGLNSVCKSIRSPFRGEIYKSRQSEHIPRYDPRSNSTAFITLRNTSAPYGSCLYWYDKKGNLVHKMGAYAKGESEYSSRFYGGHGCGDHKTPTGVAEAARRSSGSYEVYGKVSDKVCVKISDPRRCYNSSSC